MPIDRSANVTVNGVRVVIPNNVFTAFRFDGVDGVFFNGLYSSRHLVYIESVFTYRIQNVSQRGIKRKGLAIMFPLDISRYVKIYNFVEFVCYLPPNCYLICERVIVHTVAQVWTWFNFCYWQISCLTMRICLLTS